MIIAFDCDGTLEISKGPIKLETLTRLKEEGFKVGIVGNWQLAKRHITTLDFYTNGNKVNALVELGKGHVFKLYVADLHSDREAANQAGWNFIYGSEFEL